jgi:hypothetical protein
MVLGARLGPVHRAGAGGLPAVGRTHRAAVHDQSISCASRSRSSRTSRVRSQTPAACQLRSLLQQVMPRSQPISRGRSSQGMPVFESERMPARVLRSSSRGRPPLGLGLQTGKIGSMMAQGPPAAAARPWLPPCCLGSASSATPPWPSRIRRGGFNPCCLGSASSAGRPQGIRRQAAQGFNPCCLGSASSAAPDI